MNLTFSCSHISHSYKFEILFWECMIFFFNWENDNKKELKLYQIQEMHFSSSLDIQFKFWVMQLFFFFFNRQFTTFDFKKSLELFIQIFSFISCDFQKFSIFLWRFAIFNSLFYRGNFFQWFERNHFSRFSWFDF